MSATADVALKVGANVQPANCAKGETGLRLVTAMNEADANGSIHATVEIAVSSKTLPDLGLDPKFEDLRKAFEDLAKTPVEAGVEDGYVIAPDTCVGVTL